MENNDHSLLSVRRPGGPTVESHQIENNQANSSVLQTVPYNTERTAPNSFCEASITLPKDKDMHAYKRRETERQRQKDTERL